MADIGLLQTAESIAAQNQHVIDALQNNREPDLLSALAVQVQGAAAGSASIARMTTIDTDRLPRDAQTMALGKRILGRWSVTMHDFVCKSGGEEEDLRTRLLSALAGRNGTGPALLAGTLVAAFGVSPAAAALIATLLVKLVIAPATDELCRSWANSLEGAGAKL